MQSMPCSLHNRPKIFLRFKSYNNPGDFVVSRTADVIIVPWVGLPKLPDFILFLSDLDGFSGFSDLAVPLQLPPHPPPADDDST